MTARLRISANGSSRKAARRLRRPDNGGAPMKPGWIARVSMTAALCVAALWIAEPVSAQDYPARTITFVVGLGAGGGQDVNSRIYADAMSRILGQRIVVDNKTGAGGGVA